MNIGEQQEDSNQYFSVTTLQPARGGSSLSRLEQDPSVAGQSAEESEGEEQENDQDYFVTKQPRPLCCCEYTDSNQEINHLLACCCNCVPLDEICERCVTCRAVPSNLIDSLMELIADRARYPSCDGRGARRMDLQVVLPALTVPLMLWTAGLSSTASIAMLFGFQPLLLSFAYKFRKFQTKPSANCKSTKFFISWTISSFVCLLALFELQIVAFMEVMIAENLALISLCAICLWSAIVTRARSGVRRYCGSSTLGPAPSPPYRPAEDYGGGGKKEDEVLLSMSAGGDEPQHSRRSSVTTTSPTATRDQHSEPDSSSILFYSYFIRCPIHGGNIWSYIIGLVVSVAALLYGSLLTLTTICRPKYFFDDWLLIPDECIDIYDDIYVGMCFAGAIYALQLAGLITIYLLRLLISSILTKYYFDQHHHYLNLNLSGNSSPRSNYKSNQL